MKNLLKLFTISLLATTFSCVNSDEYDTPDLNGECSDLVVTKSISDIVAISQSDEPVKYVDEENDDILEAYVTSSDEGGNFYKSLSLVSVDGTRGFSIPVDDYNLYTKFEPGRKVFINLKDLYYSYTTQTSTYEIGGLYQQENEPAEIGRISLIDYQNKITRSCSKVSEDDELVNHLTITQAKNNNNLHKLIEIDNVQFTDESMNHTYFDSSLNPVPTWTATNHTIVDADGNTLIVRISEFSTFAAKSVARGNGKIRGILTKYNSDYQFMVRTERDIQLTGERIVPLFEESFTNNFPAWTKFSVVGPNQNWVLDTQFGNPGSCAKMSGFASSTNNANEDWLISPSIDLSSITNAVLSFDNASRFTGDLLEVYISNNYTSGAPSTATWTQLTGFTLDTNTSSYVWTNSGDIDISSMIGSNNVRVAFKYTSTTSASRTWEVDNVKVDGN